jgi:hypothetical protein
MVEPKNLSVYLRTVFSRHHRHSAFYTGGQARQGFLYDEYLALLGFEIGVPGRNLRGANDIIGSFHRLSRPTFHSFNTRSGAGSSKLLSSR